jgi:UDP-glucose:(indol-3-yl)acetate beta-D-glucosyltransferase
MLWIQPCALYAIYHRFYNNLNPFPTLTNPEMSVDLPGLPLLQIQDLPSFVLPSNTFGSLPKLLAETFQNMKKLKWVLGNLLNLRYYLSQKLNSIMMDLII